MDTDYKSVNFDVNIYSFLRTWRYLVTKMDADKKNVLAAIVIGSGILMMNVFR